MSDARARVVHRGRVTTPRRVTLSGLALAGPGLAWIVLLLLVPFGLIGAMAFATRGLDSEILWTATLANVRRLAGFGSFGWSADTIRIFVRTSATAALTSGLAIALAYPLAFFIADRPRRAALAWLALVVVPMSTNVVIRAYAWQLVLSPGAPPARLAAALGWLEAGRGLFPSGFAVLVGMVSTALPFAVLPLWVNVSRLDRSLVEAARDLHADRWTTFRRVILPQTRPGLASAAVLTFVPAMGMFVLPDRLGGSRFMLLGNLLQQQFGPARDYPFGAAVAAVLVGVTLLGLAVERRVRRPVELE